MNNLNSILIEGNLVKDGEFKTTSEGQVVTLTLASNRYYKQETGFEKEVSYFEVEAQGKLVDACIPKAKKGRGLRVVGRLKQDRWTDDNGKAMSRFYIIPDHIEFRPEFKKSEPEKEEDIDEVTL